MSPSSRYREVEVCGPPRELGRQVGEALGEEIRGFCATALEQVNRTVAISRAAAMRIASASLACAAGYAPEMVEELTGTAEAARVSLADLMLLQVRNQLRPEGDAGCTSLAFAAPAAGGGGLVAQNWDNDPSLDEFTVVLTRRPAGKPALTNVTQAGLIAYIGMNDAGIGVCLNSLPAPSRSVGVPHYFTVRGIYEADSLDGAVAAVRRARRAIPANILLMTPQGPADLEVTLEEVHVLRDDGRGVVTHANHCRHPDLAEINGRFPELIQSHARQSRVDALLARHQGPASLESVQRILRDHEGYPRSICRHANDDPGTGFWRTAFSVVIEPEAGRLHVSRGTPCDHPYEVYRMSP